MTTDYIMDSGLIKSYPTTGIDGNPTGGMNYKFKPGTKCRNCGEEFKDGDVARRTAYGFRHEACK